MTPEQHADATLDQLFATAYHDRWLIARLSTVRAEIERLRQWKSSAIEVLTGWEKVWDAAGRPGPLGASKSDNVAAAALRTRAGMARRQLHSLSRYDDPERGRVDPLDEPETRDALRDLCVRLNRNPFDPYGEVGS